MSETPRFRNLFRKLVPAWLRDAEEGEPHLYALGVVADAFIERLRSGLLARFPTHAPEDALAHLGRDRKIIRGIGETSAGYALRLLRWLTDHRTRGGPYAMLAQVGAFWQFSPDGPYDLALIARSGLAHEREADTGVVTRSLITWNPDAEPERWARWWLIFHWHENIGDDGVWGDPGTWGDGGVWGSGLDFATVQQLRLVPHEWNAAHCVGRIGLLGPGAELWGYPAGTWGDPGVWGGGDYTEIDVQ